MYLLNLFTIKSHKINNPRIITNLTYENGVTRARIPLVGRRLRGDVEVGQAEDNAQDLVARATGVDDVIAERSQLRVHLVNLVHADDDLLRFFGGRFFGGD